MVRWHSYLKTQAKGVSQAAETGFYNLHEGLAYQALYIGPFSNEGPVLATLHQDIMPAARMTNNGNHHEVYLSDFRKVDPQKLITVLRQPVIPL